MTTTAASENVSGTKKDGIWYVSNSEMETFMDCRRKWYLQYVLGWTKETEDRVRTAARDSGTVAHAAVEHYYKTLDKAAALQVVFDLRTAAMAEIEDPVEAKVVANKVYDTAAAMVEGYFEWLEETGADEGLHFTNIESTVFTDSPVEGVGVRGKVDHEIQNERTGTWMVGDLKTSADIQRPIQLMNLGIPQALTYVWAKGREHTDRDYVSGVWTILRSVKRSPQSKPPYFHRHWVRISAKDIAAHEEHLTGLLLVMKSTRERLLNGESHQIAAYPHRTGDCSWKCPFYDVCASLNNRITPDDLGEFGYVRRDPNERYSDPTT